MTDVWLSWLEDNYKYFAVALQNSDEDRHNVLKLARICEKHGISFKSVVEIISEFNAGEKDD